MDRRSAWRQAATSFSSDGNFSTGDSYPGDIFPTTHARARCELELVEIQAASDHVANAVHRSIGEAERLVDELVAVLHAAKAAQRAAHAAAGRISGAKS